MRNVSKMLDGLPLFEGIAPGERGEMLACMNARTASYGRQDVVLLEGGPVPSVGVVLSGAVQIVKEDFMGNRNIIAEIPQGSLFAEAYSCARVKKLPLTVVSVEKSEILWIDYDRILSTCPSDCRFHQRLIENMLMILASKNILLTRKIEHISRRSIREKVLAYLSDQAARQGSREFDIPFSRQELADYLCVDRSALSAELSRLSGEGLLRFRRSHFVLTDASPSGEA